MSIPVIDKIKPLGNFKVADAVDIDFNGSSVSEALSGAASVSYVDNAVSNKVDKVYGKGLSSNDYTTEEKTKLAGLSQVVIDTSINIDSTNTVSNKAVATALDNKVNKEQGKGLSENNFTSAEKNKLSNIENNANRTVVDTELSNVSTNAIQNKTVYNKISEIEDKLRKSSSFVTPEMFGAVGDGETDDSMAIQSAINASKSVIFNGDKTYLCNSTINIPKGAYVDFNNCTVIFNDDIGLDAYSETQEHGQAPAFITRLNAVGNNRNTIMRFDNMLKSTVSDCTFTGFEIGVYFVRGYEMNFVNLRFTGTTPNSIGMKITGSDSYFYDIILRDCYTGLLLNTSSNKFTNVHGWIYNKEYYNGSTMILDQCAGGSRNIFITPYFDTYNYCYKRTGLGSVWMDYPTVYNNYTISDRAGATQAYFLYLIFNESDRPYANRIFIDHFITQLAPNDKQIYTICNDKNLEFELNYDIATVATINKIKECNTYSISDLSTFDSITSNFITLNAGFSIMPYSRVFKQRNHIWGEIVISKNSNFIVGGLESIGTLTYQPASNINGGCFFSADEWDTTDVGYMYIADKLNIKTHTEGMNFAKVSFDYVARK